MQVTRCVRDNGTTARLGALLGGLGPGEDRAGGVAFLGASIEGRPGRRVPALVITPEYVACLDLVTVDGHGELIATAAGQWSIGGRAAAGSGAGSHPGSRAMAVTHEVQRRLDQASIDTTVFPLVLVAGDVTGVDQPDGSRPDEIVVEVFNEVPLIAALTELGVYAQRTGGHRTGAVADVSALVHALQLTAPVPDNDAVRAEGFLATSGWSSTAESLRNRHRPPALPVYDDLPEESAEPAPSAAVAGRTDRRTGRRTASRIDDRTGRRWRRTTGAQVVRAPSRLHPMVWLGLGFGLVALAARQSGWLFGLPGVVFSIGGLAGVVRRGGRFVHVGAAMLGLATSVAGLLAFRR
jgi:hypothetical protein